MIEKELNNEYFKWMCQLVQDKRFMRGLTHQKLLNHLHNVIFQFTLPMDENRAEDGKNLRYRFGYERKHDNQTIATYLDITPCSVLEMLVSLSLRCEEDIMYNPDIGDRTGMWFWNMIINLGLESMDDSHYDAEYVDKVILRFMNHKYKRNGEGGLFTIDNRECDMRTLEIWAQLNWYLDSILY